ncbi:MAG: biopolymer transporter ExbD [Calditrichaeota bacterium]|jgi:biopolymer transport protein ExbD|nr:biopolymer transporter ExbD [Calditrichota bacterium]MBT7619238.1 biopolymer transporter ExbD [Calditrichota bacterium]MBT7787571.1 biopolymer transporter ExbD [Calditrichota bacterium]
MFRKKQKPKQDIPTASLPDIIFMLLFFFMVTTVLKKSQGLPIVTPAAYQTKKIESKRHLAYIWADDKNAISIDDKLVPLAGMSTISKMMRQKLDDDNQLIVSMKIDKRAKMSLVTDIQEQLRDAYCIRVNYATKFKGGG